MAVPPSPLSVALTLMSAPASMTTVTPSSPAQAEFTTSVAVSVGEGVVDAWGAAVEEQVWPMLADGRIRLSPETRIPFTEVRRAHEQLTGGDNVGKIVLVH